MVLSKKLKYLSSFCFVLGFLVPFAASRFIGMPLGAMPLVSAANIVLWVGGLLVAYVAFLNAKKPLPSVSLWARIGMFISSEPSLFLTLGILFGYLFYPSVGRSVVPVAGPFR